MAKSLPVTREEAVKQWDGFINYLVKERYAVRNPDTGEPLEHSIHDVLNRVASQFKNQEVANAIRQGHMITATPFLMNGGNDYTRRSGYYSCYPLGHVGDSTSEIFDMERRLVSVFQHAGGGGIDVSKLRPKGSVVDRGQGSASGPVSFTKGFSHLSERISQGGKRRGALMVQMDHTHPDIKEFVTFKADNPGVFTGCNVSVNVVDDTFWENEDLIQTIAECIWKSGDPGLLFTKKSLDNTPLPNELNPVFSNPCGEFMSVANTACNLLTVNLVEIIKSLDPDTETLVSDFLSAIYEAGMLACIAGNEILDMDKGFPPIDDIKQKTAELRPVGVGMTALHYALNWLGVSYTDDAAPGWATLIQMHLMLGSMHGSMTYGEEHLDTIVPWDLTYATKLKDRCYDLLPHFPDTVDTTDIEQNIASIFDFISENGGLYNSVTTSQAPTGSISQLMSVSCTGIEPYFAKIQNRKVKHCDGPDGFKEFTLVPLEFYDYTEEKLDWVEKQTAHNVNPFQQLKILGAIQNFCHTAASKTINLPSEISKEQIAEMLKATRLSNLKGVTLFRDTSIKGVLSDGEGKKKKLEKYHEKAIRAGQTFKFGGPSSLYVTANHSDSGEVQEIFINTTHSGSTVHGLCEALGRVISVAIQHDSKLLKPISKTLKGISSEGVWSNKLLGRVFSIPAAISNVVGYLRSNIPSIDKENEEPEASTYTSCPECGKLSFKRNGGCSMCTSCGFSSC